MRVKAIILSAGQGKRLAPLTDDRPKCLLPLAGRSILEWQIRALATNGITDAVVVTGFRADAVEREVARLRFPGIRVRCLYNPFYAVADNVGSCFVARHEMTGEFVLLNGDTLFEPDVLTTALAGATAPVTVTIDHKARYDDDDMKVILADGRLRRIGKQLPFDDIDGESIGLLVFKDDGGQRFCAGLDRRLRLEGGLRCWYLSVVDELAGDGVVGVASIHGRQWAEVDFPMDVARAEALARGWLGAEQPLREEASG